MTRKVQVFVLCEDLQTSTLIRQYLVARGYPGRNIRVDKLPAACASQWVRERCAGAVHVNRTRAVAEHLVVHTDADDHAVAERHKHLADALHAAGREPRGPKEPIALVVPKWETETWLHHFLGTPDVVEDHQGYRKFSEQADAAGPGAGALLACVSGNAPPPANLPSFATAVAELRRLP